MIDNFHIIKKFKNTHCTPASTSTESNFPGDPQLSQAFNKISTSYTYSEPIFGNHGEGSHFLEKSITFPEISNTINSSKSNSAPGIDAISYSLLKKLPKSIILWLIDFYNRIISTGNYPSSWKKFKVCFIPKPGNKGYRPIALASTLLKTLERIINDRLMWWCENRNILPRFFQGFRRGKSCHDCLAPLHLDAIIAKQKKKILGV